MALSRHGILTQSLTLEFGRIPQSAGRTNFRPPEPARVRAVRTARRNRGRLQRIASPPTFPSVLQPILMPTLGSM